VECNPSPTNEVIDNPVKAEGPVKRLLRLAENAALFRSTDGRFYAQVSVGRRRETFAIRSPAFRDWLIDGYLRAYREVPSDWSIPRALGALEATARFGGTTPLVFVRVGHDASGDAGSSAYYLDLADPAGRAVRIGPDGWSVVDNPPVHFRRPDGHLPLRVPLHGGSIDLLRPYVNLDDTDFRLLTVWMAAALRPVGPYPVLVLSGEQGSAKSTLARIVRLLLDPQAAPLLAEPRTTRELMASAFNGWLLAYDNMGTLPHWLSNGLCMLATAGAVAACGPASSDERKIIHTQRPVIINGIDEFVTRTDLSDRAVFLSPPPIAPSRRRREDELWRAFSRDYPRILGGLLDAVVAGLRELPSMPLPELPRMADFAAFAAAVARGLGWPPESILADYQENRREATVSQLENSLVASVLLEHYDEIYEWSGSIDKFLDKLTLAAGRELAASPRWPKSVVGFARELRRIAPQLRTHGISIVFERNSRRRFLSISRTDRPKPDESPQICMSGQESRGTDMLVYRSPDPAATLAPQTV
jgi:hypothetical protein